MRRLAVLGSVLAVVACASPAAPPPRQAAVAPAAARLLDISNAGFEAGMKPGNRCAVGWDCTMHNNPDAFRFSLADSGGAAGSHSLCVERAADEPWALVTQAFDNPALRGKKLRLSMAVRVDGATGDGAGPWALAQGRPPAHARKLVRGTAAWERVSLEFLVPADASSVEIGATLEGPGKACFDDVRLEALPG